jgi:hypothetical protein
VKRTLGGIPRAERDRLLPCASVFARFFTVIVLALTLLCDPSLANAQTTQIMQPAKPPEEQVEARGSAREQNVEARGSAREQNTATITDVRDWRSAGLFLAGALTGFLSHEAGHVMANLLQGNVPHFLSVKGFGFIPFFTVAPRIACYHSHCTKYDGSAFSTGVPGKVAITSAGFNVQHVTDEFLLSFEPRLRYRVAPYRKGLLAFNLLLSVGYAISAITRIENREGDVTATAKLMGVPREAYASVLLAIAGLDMYRYFVPDSRWAPWVSRGSKVAFIGIVIALQ